MTNAIIQTGGKQYIVSVGEKLQVEKLQAEIGDNLELPAMATLSESDYKLGDTMVNAKVLSHGKDDKIRVFKYKAKSKYRRTIGHRQNYTEIEITKI